MILPMLPRRWADVLPGEWKRLRRGTAPLELVGAAVVAEWEECVARFLGVPRVAALSSPGRGLRLVFEHLGLGPGDEVIVPAYGSRRVVEAVQSAGAAAVSAEVSLETFHVTPASVSARISPRTRAIVVSHLFGAPAPVDEIVELAGLRGITVIEDCAEALGARIGGRRAGAVGYAGVFGLGLFDPVNTHGGALVASHDTDLVRFIHGRIAELPHDHTVLAGRIAAARRERLLVGSGLAWPLLALRAGQADGEEAGAGDSAEPASYAPVQAALGMTKLATLPERLAHRRRMAALLDSLLDPSVRLQRVPSGAESVWSRCVVLLPRRAETVRRRMLRRAVEGAAGDAVAVDCARLLGRADCPNAVDLHPNILALPFFDAVTSGQIRRAARALNASLAG